MDTHEQHWTWLCSQPATVDDEGLRIGNTYTMFTAEDELMALHASSLTANRCDLDVLEVGLGLGVFAKQLAGERIRSYTAIEPHPGVVALTRERVLDRLGFPTTVLPLPWQHAHLDDDSFDVIMFDTWPPPGYADKDFSDFVTDVAIRVLRPEGRFGFFTSGCNISESRIQVLDRHFFSWNATPYQFPNRIVPQNWSKPTTDFLVITAQKEA